MGREAGRKVEATEPAHTPPMGLFFAYIAMLPLVLGTLVLWLAPEAQSFLALNLTLFWGAAILTFLSGVRRGVSFRQPDGPRLSQIAMMLWLFLAGFVSLVLVIWAFPLLAVGLELLAYLSLAILDPWAAKRGDAPLFFKHLRPPQMALPVLSLIAVGVFVWHSPFL